MIGFDDCGGAPQRLLRESRNEAWTPVYMFVGQVFADDWAVFRGRRDLETGIETKSVVSWHCGLCQRMTIVWSGGAGRYVAGQLSILRPPRCTCQIIVSQVTRR
jgi:hypothetical protein